MSPVWPNPTWTVLDRRRAAFRFAELITSMRDERLVTLKVQLERDWGWEKRADAGAWRGEGPSPLSRSTVMRDYLNRIGLNPADGHLLVEFFGAVVTKSD